MFRRETLSDAIRGEHQQASTWMFCPGSCLMGGCVDGPLDVSERLCFASVPVKNNITGSELNKINDYTSSKNKPKGLILKIIRSPGITTVLFPISNVQQG